MRGWLNLVVISTTVMIFMLNAEKVEAKRGCASFGHSCYGGMGKRASTNEIYDTNEEVLQKGYQDLDENPAFVFTGPRSGSPRVTPQQYEIMSKIIRKWVESYRKNQELRGENNI